MGVICSLDHFDLLLGPIDRARETCPTARRTVRRPRESRCRTPTFACCDSAGYRQRLGLAAAGVCRRLRPTGAEAQQRSEWQSANAERQCMLPSRQCERDAADDARHSGKHNLRPERRVALHAAMAAVMPGPRQSLCDRGNRSAPLERRRHFDRPRHHLRRAGHHHRGPRHARRAIGRRANVAAVAPIEPAARHLPAGVAAGQAGQASTMPASRESRLLVMVSSSASSPP